VNLTLQTLYNSAFLGSCYFGTKLIIVFKFLFLCWGVVLATQTRAYPAAFNESKFIFWILYTIGFSSIIAVPIIATSTEPRTIYLLSSIVIIWVGLLSAVVLIGHKLYYVLHPPPESYFDTQPDLGESPSRTNSLVDSKQHPRHNKSKNDSQQKEEDDKEKEQLRNSIAALTKEITELRNLLRPYRPDLVHKKFSSADESPPMMKKFSSADDSPTMMKKTSTADESMPPYRQTSMESGLQLVVSSNTTAPHSPSMSSSQQPKQDVQMVVTTPTPTTTTTTTTNTNTSAMTTAPQSPSMTFHHNEHQEKEEVHIAVETGNPPPS